MATKSLKSAGTIVPIIHTKIDMDMINTTATLIPHECFCTNFILTFLSSSPFNFFEGILSIYAITNASINGSTVYFYRGSNKLNNNVSNLEWVTKKDNSEHAWNNGLAKPSRSMLGKKNPNAGRKGKPFRIVETGEVFNTLYECEKAIDGNNRHINDCLKGRQRTHRGYHFEYL